LTAFRVIHRQDYHAILLEEAQRLGAEIKLNSDVVKLNFDRTEVILSDGQVLKGDVIVGADGRPILGSLVFTADY
jgi:salicylate hydroxylase